MHVCRSLVALSVYGLRLTADVRRADVVLPYGPTIYAWKSVGGRGQ
jgi:hypothetical protein